MLKRLHSGPAAALLEVGVLFLPAIPAYLWLWPNLQGTAAWIAQSLVYVYVLAGTLFIGRRRWNWSQLGINTSGLKLSLACALAWLLGRLLIILSINWVLPPPQVTASGLALDILYYFGLVGLVEELLFRGLLYRALEDWRGTGWAIFGSSIGFMLWHIFGQGPLIGITTLVIGLAFALLRWRAGGILGLVILHALWDLETVLLVSADTVSNGIQTRPEIFSPAAMWLGLALLAGVPLYLWKLHPFFQRWLKGWKTHAEK